MKEKGPRRRRPRFSPSPSPPSPIALIRRVLFASPELRSPKSTVIHAKTKSKFRKTSVDAADDQAPPVAKKAKASPPGSNDKQMRSIEDVKDFVSSQLEKLKRVVDLSHSASLKDFDASHSRLQKRLKGQMQKCQELMDEEDAECKKVSEQMSENRKAMKATFSEFMQATQSNSSHGYIQDVMEDAEFG